MSKKISCLVFFLEITEKFLRGIPVFYIFASKKNCLHFEFLPIYKRFYAAMLNVIQFYCIPGNSSSRDGIFDIMHKLLNLFINIEIIQVKATLSQCNTKNGAK